MISRQFWTAPMWVRSVEVQPGQMLVKTAVEVVIPNSGGRKAAAMTLAEHGIGIKVSNDGHITAWSRRAEDGQALFEIG